MSEEAAVVVQDSAGAGWDEWWPQDRAWREKRPRGRINLVLHVLARSLDAKEFVLYNWVVFREVVFISVDSVLRRRARMR